MILEIVRVNALSTHTIDWFEADTPDGNFVIKDGHAPTLLMISPGNSITFHHSHGATETVAVRSGIAHITRHTITLLLSESL